MKTSLVLLAVLSLSVACAKKESNNDLRQINELNEKATETYEKVVAVNGQNTRDNKFEILNSKDEKFGAKIAAAALYFQNFEFQTSTSKSKDAMLLSAAEEFTKRIGDLYEELNLRRMSPRKEGKAHSEEQAFYALSITMHLNNHYQQDLLDNKAGAKAISFYDIMKSALTKDYTGDAMKDYEEVLVSNINKDIMVDLIKARVDMFSALALKNLTDKKKRTWGQRLKEALFTVSAGKYGAIELPENFANSNEPTKKQTIKYLEAAMKAKKFLSGVGVEKSLERTLKSAFSELKLGGRDEPAEDGEVQEEESKEEASSRKTEIKNLIDDLLK